jgi:hypothetical protein
MRKGVIFVVVVLVVLSLTLAGTALAGNTRLRN